MTYIVHINPIPGTDSPRTIEVEARDFRIQDGSLILHLAVNGQSGTSDYADYGYHTRGVASFSPGVWIYVEPKK